jgi:hypothetical protein
VVGWIREFVSSLQLLSVFNININFLLGGSGAVVKIKIKGVSSIIVNRDMFVLNASANAIRLGLLGGGEGHLPAIAVAVSWQA